MHIVIADDEPLALRMMNKIITQVLPEAEVHAFLNGEGLIDFAKENQIAVAFLDIQMRGITGTELAEQLQEIQPRLNVIFCTAFDDYKSEAMDLRASGYVMKPVTAEGILKELSVLRFPLSESGAENGEESEPKIVARCFGDFTVTFQGNPLQFSYVKTNELLALLIDRNGAMCSYALIEEMLWEGEGTHLSYLKRMRSDLKNTLEQIGMQDIICAKKGMLGLIPERIECDYFDFLAGKPQAIASYQGAYMSQYFWSEETNATLYWRKQEILTGKGEE